MWTCGEQQLAAMLAVKRLAGVTPEVNLRNIHHKVLSQMQVMLPTLALKPRGNVTRSPKQGISSPIELDMYPPIFFYESPQFKVVLSNQGNAISQTEDDETFLCRSVVSVIYM